MAISQGFFTLSTANQPVKTKGQTNRSKRKGKPTGQNERANQPVNMKELLTSNDPVIDNELG
jgi:hypothetical protein